MEGNHEMYLIPKPKQLEKQRGSFWLRYDSRIVLSPEVGSNGMVYANILKSCIQTWTGQRPEIVKGKPREGDIFLCRAEGLDAEEYRLTIGKQEIVGAGGDGAGILYAVQTLCQIVEQCKGELPCVEIADKPYLKHRGYYLEETRG